MRRLLFSLLACVAVSVTACGANDPEALVGDVVSAAQDEDTSVLCEHLGSDFLSDPGEDCGMRVSTMEAIASLSSDVSTSDIDDDTATVVTSDGEWSFEEVGGDWKIVATSHKR